MSAGVGPAAAAQPAGTERGPAGDRDGVEGARRLGDPRASLGIPAVATVRVGDQRTIGGHGGSCEKGAHVARRGAVDTDRHDARCIAESDGGADGLTGRGAVAITTGVAQPGRRSDVLEQVDEHLGFADGRDGLEREQVDARLEQRFHAGPVEGGQGIGPWVVVAAVLGSVGEHRAVRPDRPCHQESLGGAIRLFAVAVTRAPGERHASADRVERGRAVEAGGCEPRDRRLVARRGRHVCAGAVVREMDGLDRVGIAQQEAGRPESVGQVVTRGLELGREAAVEDDHGSSAAGPHPRGRDQAIRAKSAGARLMNRPAPLRPVNCPSRTTTEPREKTTSLPPRTARPS